MQKVIAILLFLFSLLSAQAQKDTINQDNLFQKARELAFSNNWKAARSIAREILKKNDKYYDARILIGRTYAWENKYDSARIELSAVIKSDSSNLDALSALTDVNFWSKNYEVALSVCNKALSFSPYDKALLIKKVKILLALGRENEARSILSTLLKIDPYGSEINALLAGLTRYIHRIAIEHIIDYYKIPAPFRWNASSLQYQYDSRTGSFIGEFNVGQNVAKGQSYLSNPQAQLDIEAYPIIHPGTYVYCSYGISPGYFFPKHKFALEPYQALGKGWECSIGGRYFILLNSGDVKIYTGSISKYYQNNMISFRPFFTFAIGNTQSYYFQYRHYFSSILNYLGGAIGYGNSPENNNSIYYGTLQSKYASYNGRLEFEHTLLKHFLIRLIPQYTYESYKPNVFRSELNGDIYLAWLF